VVYMLEPGRFREARGEREARHRAPDAVRTRLYPDAVAARVFLTHTRPETSLGVLKPLATGAATVALGYTNHGGTLSVGGLLFVNRATWAHVLEAVARVTGLPRAALLTEAELAALDRRAQPVGVIV
ncbi:MAG: xylulose 5-phosphate 3-epimerase, partial [Candidatus Rokuibacteriota bacterium]